MPHDPIQSSSPPGSPPGPHPAAARRRAQSAGHERRVFWVMWLTGGFMLLEGFGGWIAGSLALAVFGLLGAAIGIFMARRGRSSG